MDDVIGRMQEIAERIRQIRQLANGPQSPRTETPAETAAAGTETTASAAARAAELTRFQALLDQAIASSTESTGTSSLDLLNGILGAGAGTEGTVPSVSSELQRYQDMLLDAIRLMASDKGESAKGEETQGDG